MHRGYIKLWRKSIESQVWDNPDVWRFWTYCLMKASHKNHTAVIGFQEVDLEPGQFIFGRKIASEETGLSEQTIRTCIKYLKHKNLTIKPTNKFSIISIINWDGYQSQENEINQQPNHEVTNNQPTSNQQVTTYKNDKNIKNDKNVKNKDIYVSVCEYLNQKTGKKYKPSSKATQGLIRARINEGFKQEDFLTVIDNQCVKWLTDPKMMEYLRPQTLFGTKFESYLNNTPNPLTGKFSDKTIKNIETLNEWSPPNEGSSTV